MKRSWSAGAPTKVAAALIVAAFLVSASALSYSRLETTETRTVTQNPQTSTVTVTTHSTANLSATNQTAPIDCDTAPLDSSYFAPTNETGLPYEPYEVGDYTNYQCERVLTVPPGGTAKFVVWYETDLNGISPASEGGSDIANLSATVFAPVISRVPEIPPPPPTFTNATGITVTPSISSINVAAFPNGTAFNIAYTVKVSNGISGFFLLEYSDACPTRIPFAIGYTPAEINASAFAYYNQFDQGCTQMGILPGGTLVSVTGIQFAWMVQTVQRQ